jgi:hypothetical protein
MTIGGWDRDRILRRTVQTKPFHIEAGSMNAQSALLVAFLAEAVAGQPSVQLQLHVGSTGAGKLDQPSLSWSGNDLKVSAVASMTATSEVESQSPGISLSDDKLTLCFHQKITTPAPGEMVPHWARPVLLEFTVKGLPKQDYKVDIVACS